MNFLPKNAKKQPYTGPVNLQNVLELEEVSSCTQGIQASAFRHFRIIIRTISWLDQFPCYLFLTTWGFSLLVQVVYSWDFTCECVGVTEQLLGLEAGVQCSLLSFRLEKLQRVGWKCPVFTTEACLPLPPSPALSTLCYDEFGYLTGEFPLMKLCKRSNLSHVVMVGYKIHELFKEILLLSLKCLC